MTESTPFPAAAKGEPPRPCRAATADTLIVPPSREPSLHMKARIAKMSSLADTPGGLYYERSEPLLSREEMLKAIHKSHSVGWMQTQTEELDEALSSAFAFQADIYAPFSPRCGSSPKRRQRPFKRQFSGDSASAVSPDSVQQTPIPEGVEAEADEIREEDEEGPSQFQITCAIANMLVGVGMLSMPFGMAATGGALGVVIVLGVVGLMFFTATLIAGALELTSAELDSRDVPRERRDFAVLAELAFGQVGKAVIACVFLVEMWTAMETMIVLFAANLEVLTGLAPSAGITLCTAITFMLLFTSMKFLSYLSAVSLFASSFSVVALLVTGLSLPGGDEEPEFATYHELWRPDGVMTMTGLALFSFAAHPALPSMYWSMKNPSRDFMPALAKAFALALFFYSVVCGIGYYYFGDYVRQVFTANLGKDLHGHRLPNLSFLGAITSLGFVLKLQGTTPMILGPVTTVLEQLLGIDAEERTSPKRLIVLFIIGLISWAIATLFAHQCAILAGLCGILMVMTTSVIFPSWMYLSIGWEHLRVWRRASLLLIGMAGAAFAIYGTYGTVVQMMKDNN
eukprot:gnl/TRDRNA2_/TRDRNA2_204892_c0_seq1.p1 gnl/TRDRNA2_/TRDRNA2_204892_c0~~gnl/TRDRNA2_/TRDRNA2_204892_c0_seq1.p1  ORF type:complete len:570 (-),score=81.55 gnl/TRDRNA2_/TRDRNA2_204892_c0_seq1:305-2014(-)